MKIVKKYNVPLIEGESMLDRKARIVSELTFNGPAEYWDYKGELLIDGECAIGTLIDAEYDMEADQDAV